MFQNRSPSSRVAPMTERPTISARAMAGLAEAPAGPGDAPYLAGLNEAQSRPLTLGVVYLYSARRPDREG